MLKRLLPGPVVALIRDWRQTEPAARLTLLRLRVSFLRQADQGLPANFPNAATVLFVCHGNILRSAVGAELLGHAVRSGAAPAGVRAHSAGLHARLGKSADPRGRQVAAELGISLEQHRSQPVTEELIGTADLILVMDRVNQAELIARHPSAATRVRLLGVFTDGDPVIVDPYSGSLDDVRATFGRVREGVRGFVDRLAATEPV